MNPASSFEKDLRKRIKVKKKKITEKEITSG